MAQCCSWRLVLVASRRGCALTAALVRGNLAVRQQTQRASGAHVRVALAAHAVSNGMMVRRSAATAEGMSALLKGSRWLLHDAQCCFTMRRLAW
jgi:hypothetical protein